MSMESLLGDPKVRETLKKIIEYEEKQEQKFKTDPAFQGLDMKPYWELMDIPASWHIVRKLIFAGVVERPAKKWYILKDRESAKKALEEYERKMKERQQKAVETTQELPEDLFDVIEGYDDLKEFIKMSLRADEPVHVLLVGPPGCISEDEKILTWENGKIESVPISELYQRFMQGKIPYVLTLGKSLTVMPALPIKSGKRKVYQIKTVVGSVKCSGDHPLFKNKNEIVQISDLKPGDKILYIKPIKRLCIGYDRENKMPHLRKIFQIPRNTCSPETQNTNRRIQEILSESADYNSGCKQKILGKINENNERILEAGVSGSRGKEGKAQRDCKEQKEAENRSQVSNMWKTVQDVYNKWQAGEKVLLGVVLSKSKDIEVQKFNRNKKPDVETGSKKEGVTCNKGKAQRSFVHIKNFSQGRKAFLDEDTTRSREIQKIHEISKRAWKKEVYRVGGLSERTDNTKRDEKGLQVESRKNDEQNPIEYPRNYIPLECSFKNGNRNEVPRFSNNISQKDNHRGGWTLPQRERKGGYEEKCGLYEVRILDPSVQHEGSGEGNRECSKVNIRHTKRIWATVPILEIREMGFEESYDLIVPFTHNFIHECGIVIHNTAKSLFLMEIERLGARFITAGTSTKVGIRDIIYDELPRILIIDEIDKIADPNDLSALLTWMESGRIIITKHGLKDERRGKGWVFAAANTLRKLAPELIDRFEVFHVKPYTKEQFIRVVTGYLTKRKEVPEDLARYIAEKVQEYSVSVREAIRISRVAKTKNEVDRAIEIIRKYRGGF